jgi:hypothetical protein
MLPWPADVGQHRYKMSAPFRSYAPGLAADSRYIGKRHCQLLRPLNRPTLHARAHSNHWWHSRETSELGELLVRPADRNGARRGLLSLG